MKMVAVFSIRQFQASMDFARASHVGEDVGG